MSAAGEMASGPAGARVWPWGLLAARLIVGGLFLFAASLKIGNPTAFGGAIEGFKLLDASITLEFGLLLIWLEILCGALLVLGIWSRPAALLIAGMLCLFFVALASAVVRGLEIDCGCFGALMQGGIGWGSLARTLVLLGLAVLVFRWGPGRFALGRE